MTQTPLPTLEERLTDAVLKLLVAGSGGYALYNLYLEDIPKAAIAAAISFGSGLMTSFGKGLMTALGDYLDIESIRQFLCKDLHTIDRLWVKYSKGRFGFSVQKEIWLEAGGEMNVESYKKLGDCIGWRVNEEWIAYSKVKWDASAPISPALPDINGTAD